MFHLNDARARRHELRNQAEALCDAAIASGKDLSGEELKKYKTAVVELKDIEARIARHEAGLPQPDDNPSNRPNLNARFENRDNNTAKPTPVDWNRFHSEVGAYLRHGQIMAADTPVYVGTGAGVESVGITIPSGVLNALAAYTNVDSFGQAGARILPTEDTNPLAFPVISAGPAASSFAEGASSTESQPFAMDGFTLGGLKYSRLVKVSDEALMNSAIPLESAIVDELASGVATTFTAAITTALLAALGANAAVLKAQGTDDIYTALLSVMHAVPPRFASPKNKWMLSRATMAKVKDARTDGSGTPFFNPESLQIFGHDSVVNDNLSGGQVVYGDWNSGAVIRKSPFFLLRLTEQYSGEGKVGFRATQWLDQGFLCSLSGVPNQPLYYSVLS